MPNYFYNGVELPELPEWDKATYPYAVITVEDNAAINKVHALWCSKNPAIYYNLMKQLQFGGETGATSVLNDGDTEWGELYESELTHNNAGCAVIWANYDVHYCQYQGNGSYVATDEIFLPASDPVPVPDEPEPDEPETPEPTLTERDLYKKINGQPTKLTLYKKVGGELVALDEYTQGGNL